MTTYTYPQLVGLAQSSGFTGQSAYTAAAIAMAESSGNAGSINYADPGGSYGLMQINQAAHPGTSTQALDPQGSFDLAYQISNQGTNFGPWSTFNSGAYSQYLDTSVSASPAGSGSLGPLDGGAGAGMGSEATSGTAAPAGTPGSTASAAGALGAVASWFTDKGIRFGLIALGIGLLVIAAWGFVEGEHNNA
jgi:hypothetical protein